MQLRAEMGEMQKQHKGQVAKVVQELEQAQVRLAQMQDKSYQDLEKLSQQYFKEKETLLQANKEEIKALQTQIQNVKN